MEPLFFVPFFEEKPWGGDRLSKLYAKYPANIAIGNSWELSSVIYRQTFVRNGEYAGTMLSELYRNNPELFGTTSTYFPFVIKLIDASRTLPVLVHGGGLKDGIDQIEGNYIIDVDDPVKVVSGTTLKNNLELFNAIANNSLADSLKYIYVTAGDSFIVPPGTLFSLGGGMLAYSITTPLIETASVYDWGKYSGYSLDKVVDSFRFDDSIEKFEQQPLGQDREVVLDCELFRVERIDAIVSAEEHSRDKFSVYTALAPGRIDYQRRVKKFRAGDTFLIPANFGNYTVTGGKLLKASPKK
jgi:mannose-6-phosphate isomerase